MSSTLLELKFPDPDNTNPTLLNEFQKFMKEKSGDSYLPISEKKYLEFVEILRGFWENFFNIHSIPYNNGFSVFIRFMSEGLTEASVFRVEADIVGDKAKETVFICKYDTIEKINKEVKNKNIVIRRKEKIFPIFELPYTKEGFDKSILAMNSAMDSNLAETIFTAIKYILSESERDKTLREYYQKEISSTLSTVYKALFEVFYNTKKGQIYIENSIQDLFSEYLDYNRLDKKPPHPEHGVFTEKLKKAQNETGESIEISSFFSDMEDFNALLAGLAIHKDLNPNNILIAIGEDRTAAPMIIDFFEMQSLDSHDGNNWLPLFFDYARLEAQISLYFFYDIQNQEPSLSNQELYQAFTEFIEKLNSGKYVKIEGNYPNIKTSSLQFLYYILFSLRKYIFKLMHEDKPEIKKELIFKNYLFTLTSFYFTFPKMNLEEGIETKWNLSLLGAIHSKKQLLSLKEGLDYEALYNPSKSEELNIEKNRREYLEKYTNKYIPLENNTKQILEFLVSESKSHLFIEASPGMGKSSLMAYTTEVLNGNLLNHSFPDNFYCIPVFLGDDKSSNFKPIFSDREESITSNILGYFISVLVHTFKIHIFEEWKKSTQIELFKNICSEVNSWLYHQGKKLIFLIDSIQDEENWESYILFNLSTNFKYILSARPKEELHNLITEKSTQKIELTNFSDTDIYALGEIYNIPFTESHISLLMEKTNGYPIYIRLLIEMMIKQGEEEPKLKLENLEENLKNIKPTEIKDLYKLYERLISIENPDILNNILYTLVLAEEHLSIDQIFLINELKYTEYFQKYYQIEEKERIKELLKVKFLHTIKEVLEIDSNGKYKLFHPSFSEYLYDKYKNEITNFKNIFSEYFKNYPNYKTDSIHSKYCEKYAGINLFFWGKENKDFILLLEEIFINSLKVNDRVIIDNFSETLAIKQFYTENTRFEVFIDQVFARILDTNFRYNLFLWLNNRGEYLRNIGFSSTWCFSYYKKSLLVIQKLLNFDSNSKIFNMEFAKTLYFLGNFYYENGVFEKALEFLEYSFSIMENLFKKEPESLEIKRDLSIFMNNLGNIFINLGKTEQGLLNFDYSIQLMEDLSKIEQDNLDFKQLLSVFYNNIGKIFMDIGKLDKAQKYFEDSIALKEEILEFDYNKIEIKLALSVTYNNLGIIYIYKKNEKKALLYLENSIEIIKELNIIEPNRIDFMEGISRSFNSITVVYSNTSEFDKAIQFSNDSIKITKLLIDLEPNQSKNHQYLSTSYNNLASIYDKKNDEDNAILFWKKSIDIMNKLVQLEEERTDYKKELSQYYSNLASFLYDKSKFKDAKELLENSIIIMRELIQKEPTRIDFKLILSVSLIKINNILIELKDEKNALKNYEESISILLGLSLAEPQNLYFIELLSWAFRNIGKIYLNLNIIDQSIKNYEESFIKIQKCIEIQPQNIKFKEEAYSIAVELGNIYMKLNNFEQSIKYYKYLISICKELTQLDPQNIVFKKNLSVTYFNLGNIYLVLKNINKSNELWEISIKILRELIEIDSNNIYFNWEFSIYLSKLGNLYLELKEDKKAFNYFEESFTILEKLIKLEPKNLHFKIEFSNILTNLGKVYMNLANTEKALEHWENSINIKKEILLMEPNNLDLKREYSNFITNIGNIYMNLKNTEKAIKHWEYSINIRKEILLMEPNRIEFMWELVINLNRISELFLTQQDESKALNHYRDSFKLMEKLIEYEPKNENFNRELGASYINIGNYYFNKENIKESKFNFDKALVILNNLLENKIENTNVLFHFSRISYLLFQISNDKTYLTKAYNFLSPLNEERKFERELKAVWEQILEALK